MDETDAGQTTGEAGGQETTTVSVLPPPLSVGGGAGSLRHADGGLPSCMVTSLQRARGRLPDEVPAQTNDLSQQTSINLQQASAVRNLSVRLEGVHIDESVGEEQAQGERPVGETRQPPSNLRRIGEAFQGTGGTEGHIRAHRGAGQ